MIARNLSALSNLTLTPGISYPRHLTPPSPMAKAPSSLLARVQNKTSSRLGQYLVDPIKNMSDSIVVLFPSCCCVDCCKRVGCLLTPLDLCPSQSNAGRCPNQNKGRQADAVDLISADNMSISIVVSSPLWHWLLQAQRAQPWRFLSSLW